MTEVIAVEKPDLHGKRLSFTLAEDRVGHYSEFRDFFVRTFELDQKGLSEPGYIRAPSGLVYALVFIGRSGELFHPASRSMQLWMRWSPWMARRSTAIYGPFCAG